MLKMRTQKKAHLRQSFTSTRISPHSLSFKNMVVNFPCKVYCKPVSKNHDSIQCNKCNIWVHRNCNKTNKTSPGY